MEDFLRQYLKILIQGQNVSTDDAMYLNKIKTDLLNSAENLQNNIKFMVYIICQETYNYLNNLSTYLPNRYTELLKQYGETIETHDKFLTEYNEYYKRFENYTNKIRIIFQNASQKIEGSYNENDYLYFFNNDKNFVEYMKNLIYMGNKENNIFIYDYEFGKFKHANFPKDYFNLLWLYFIIKGKYYNFYSNILKSCILYGKQSSVQYIIKIKELDRWHRSKLIKLKPVSENLSQSQLENINKENMNISQTNKLFIMNYKQLMDIDQTIIDTLDLFYEMYKDYSNDEYYKIAGKILGENMQEYLKYLHNVKDIHIKFNKLFFVESFDKIKDILDSYNIDLMKNIGNLYNLSATENKDYVNKVIKYYEPKLEEENKILENKIEKRKNMKPDHFVIYLINDIIELLNKYNFIDSILFPNIEHSFKVFLFEKISVIINGIQPGKEKKRLYIIELLMKFLGIVMTGRLEKYIKTDEQIKTLYANKYNINDEFEKIIQIYSYLDDKDEFKIKYERNLSKNLLMSSEHINLANEINFYNHLKNASGEMDSVRKLLNDSISYTDYLKEYEKSQLFAELNEKYGIKFIPRIYPHMYINVIGNEGYDTKKGLIIPEELKPVIDEYTKDYIRRYPSRKLEFVHKFSKLEIDFINDLDQRFVIICNTLQGIILFVLGKQGDLGLTLEDLVERTNINKNVIEGSLNEAIQIGLVITQDNRYIINKNFTNPTYRIILKYNVTTEEEVKKEIDKMTQYEKGQKIDAAIVRTLKKKKRISINDLFAETATDLSGRFTMNIQEFKQRLAILMDKDYAERSKDNIDIIEYIA